MFWPGARTILQSDLCMKNIAVDSQLIFHDEKTLRDRVALFWNGHWKRKCNASWVMQSGVHPIGPAGHDNQSEKRREHWAARLTWRAMIVKRRAKQTNTVLAANPGHRCYLCCGDVAVGILHVFTFHIFQSDTYSVKHISSTQGGAISSYCRHNVII